MKPVRTDDSKFGSRKVLTDFPLLYLSGDCSDMVERSKVDILLPSLLFWRISV